MGRCKAVHTTYISISTPRCRSLVGYSVEVHNLGAEMAGFSLAESLLAAQDELEAVLQVVDAAAMCQLKAVSGGVNTYAYTYTYAYYICAQRNAATG